MPEGLCWLIYSPRAGTAGIGNGREAENRGRPEVVWPEGNV